MPITSRTDLTYKFLVCAQPSMSVPSTFSPHGMHSTSRPIVHASPSTATHRCHPEHRTCPRPFLRANLPPSRSLATPLPRPTQARGTRTYPVAYSACIEHDLFDKIAHRGQPPYTAAAFTGLKKFRTASVHNELKLHCCFTDQNTFTKSTTVHSTDE